ncbi:class I SAM-dependent methyltransferase [Legionella spiritensis]|uniref:SAM-dependent methyltransferase n=1 Tax=Legionella spiritensis TaxID=452 RepID=A0A0W0ZB08_LEGSP|nr:SAM-dependent methyltransferase [Legionella spiritensis]KTD66276.1 hypothetical protein Lspi_0039 [Legionella spiritensis]SNV48435.1 Uncharacterized ACR, COG1565 [Legionella spiritensis]
MNAMTSLQTLLRQRHEIPFAEFMQHALYAPDGGYYTSGLQKFGPEGDFITAPELTPLFGQTLAQQCLQLFTTINDPVVFEFGAGSGRLCVDLLAQLERLQSLPTHYDILEVSGHLRHRQQALVEQEIPHLANRVRWLDRWPKKPFCGVMIANEILDAMPVHRFMQTTSGLCESMVTLNSAGELQERFKPCTNQRLLDYIQRNLPSLPPSYQSEVNLFIDDWLQECGQILAQGAMLIFDYGFPRHEYYHPDRHQGTLMCHYHHQAHSNPLVHIGEQDITAHVDFTHVAEAGHAAGFHVSGYTNQASFLLANGLLSLLEAIEDKRTLFRAQQAVKRLIQPDEMGELFKVIALTKQIDVPLQGFQWHDKRASL